MGVGIVRRSWAMAAAVGLLWLAGVAAPFGAEGQDTADRTTSEYSGDRLEALTRVYLALSEIRDDLHRELAGTHQVGVREEIRQRAERRRFEALGQHGVAAEEYEDFTFAVSTDEEVRDAFEAALLRLRSTTP